MNHYQYKMFQLAILNLSQKGREVVLLSQIIIIFSYLGVIRFNHWALNALVVKRSYYCLLLHFSFLEEHLPHSTEAFQLFSSLATETGAVQKTPVMMLETTSTTPRYPLTNGSWLSWRESVGCGDWTSNHCDNRLLSCTLPVDHARSVT